MHCSNTAICRSQLSPLGDKGNKPLWVCTDIINMSTHSEQSFSIFGEYARLSDNMGARFWEVPGPGPGGSRTVSSDGLKWTKSSKWSETLPVSAAGSKSVLSESLKFTTPSQCVCECVYVSECLLWHWNSRGNPAHFHWDGGETRPNVPLIKICGVCDVVCVCVVCLKLCVCVCGQEWGWTPQQQLGAK